MSEQNSYVSSYTDSSVFSVLGEDANFEGNVNFHGVLHINGDYIGKIDGSGDLAVGLTGRVKSVIHARNVFVSGLVWGEIHAKGKVTLSSSAIVIGSISAGSLYMEEGTILHGGLEIGKPSENASMKNRALNNYRKHVEQERSAGNKLEAKGPETEKESLAERETAEKKGSKTGKKSDKDSGYSVW